MSLKSVIKRFLESEQEKVDEAGPWVLSPTRPEEGEWTPTPVQVPNDLVLTEHFDRDLGIAWFEPALSSFPDHSPLDWLRYRAAIARYWIKQDTDVDLKLEITDSEGTTNGKRRKGEYSINGSHSYTEQEALFCIFAYCDGARDLYWKIKNGSKP